VTVGDHVHVFGESRAVVFTVGPMEGDWLAEECLYCNAFTLRLPDPRTDDDQLGLVLAQLEHFGCSPQPAEPNNHDAGDDRQEGEP
jgi:hypothetical protein